MPHRKYLPVIVAHPARRPLFERLHRELQGIISLDDQRGIGGEKRAYRAHWRAIQLGLAITDGRHSHLLIVEDDAVPLEGWDKRVAKLCAENEDNYVGLYVGQVAPRWPQQKLSVATQFSGTTSLDDRAVWGVAYLWPVSAGTPNYTMQYPTPERSLTAHLEGTGRCLHAVPTVFDHDDEADSLVSMGRSQVMGRVAWPPKAQPVASFRPKAKEEDDEAVEDTEAADV